MYYCGLDVSRKSTHAYIEDAQGRRVKYAVVPTTPTGLASMIDPYVARGLRVAVEAGNQTAWIVDLLREAGVADMASRADTPSGAADALRAAIDLYAEFLERLDLAKADLERVSGGARLH